MTEEHRRFLAWLNDRAPFVAETLAKHWYMVELVYHNNKIGKRVAANSMLIGVSDRRELMNFREIKKQYARSGLLDYLPKFMLCNGHITLTIYAYIGWLKAPRGRGKL